MTKFHWGEITNWRKKPIGEDREIIVGLMDGYMEVMTSVVVSHDETTGEVETRNARYKLIGPGDGT